MKEEKSLQKQQPFEVFCSLKKTGIRNKVEAKFAKEKVLNKNFRTFRYSIGY